MTLPRYTLSSPTNKIIEAVAREVGAIEASSSAVIGYPQRLDKMLGRDLLRTICEKAAKATLKAIDVPSEGMMAVGRQWFKQDGTGERDAQRCWQAMLLALTKDLSE